MNIVKRNGAFFPAVMDELLKDWAGGSQMVHKTVPPVNIKETESAFAVELIAPGLKKEDFSIEVDNSLLTISSEIKAENTAAEGKFTKREFIFQSFKRSFTLPETVQEDAINAVYENGILKLQIPKKEEALPKAKRMIEIA